MLASFGHVNMDLLKGTGLKSGRKEQRIYEKLRVWGKEGEKERVGECVCVYTEESSGKDNTPT